MYITPNSDLWLLKGVPLEPTYDHTIYWNKEGTPQQIETEKQRQVNFFKTNYPYIHIDKNSYIRADRNSIKVNVPSEKMYSYNYMMFCNNWQNDYLNPPDYDNPTGKWFFCFITKIEYINNKTSRVYFEVDDIQTWHFDYELEQCYVERNHTLTDYIGDNIISENVPLGEEYVINSWKVYDMNDMALVALYTHKADEDPSSTIASNVYTGLNFMVMPVTYTDPSTGQTRTFGKNAMLLIQQLSTAMQEGNLITHLYQAPLKIITKKQSGDPLPAIEYEFQNWDTWNTNGDYYEPYTEIFNYGKLPDNLDGYIPKNNKLFTYPYSFMEIINHCGDSRTLKYENFDINETTDPIKFNITGCFAPVPEVKCEPRAYRNTIKDSSSSISYNNFPLCAWTTDAFKAWLAQNWGNLLTGAVSSGINSTIAANNASSAAAGIAGAVSGSAINVLRALSSVMVASQLPKEVKGNSSNTLNAGERYIQFDFRRMSIKKQFAKIIDNFFTRFGYAIMDNIVPVLNARPHWTFVKTIDCTIKGSIPAEALRHIVSIYNAGITWWNNAAEIGNYNLDNSPTGTPGVVGTGRVGSAVVGQAIT